mmetsp:Transcript_74898/g.201206  ORF Transcript_74898/g.201206 Transcript_74898/m.201206 type:complete len:232 (+) Transcript_74898:398-1093(+)
MLHGRTPLGILHPLPLVLGGTLRVHIQDEIIGVSAPHVFRTTRRPQAFESRELVRMVLSAPELLSRLGGQRDVVQFLPYVAILCKQIGVRASWRSFPFIVILPPHMDCANTLDQLRRPQGHDLIVDDILRVHSWSHCPENCQCDVFGARQVQIGNQRCGRVVHALCIAVRNRDVDCVRTWLFTLTWHQTHSLTKMRNQYGDDQQHHLHATDRNSFCIRRVQSLKIRWRRNV